MIEQYSKNPLSAKFFRHVHTLNPPEVSIAPIAPLASDKQLADNSRGRTVLDFRHKIRALRRVAQKSLHTEANTFDIQVALFGFQRHPRVEVSNDGCVGELSFANCRFDARPLMNPRITPINANS